MKPSPATGAETGETPIRLLIVEDHQLLAATLAMALRLRGMEVETAVGPSIDAVVALARRMSPVLVLLDLDLGPPLGDGADLIRPLVDTGAQVVVVTGIEDRSRLGACLEAGAAGVVSKSAGFEHLVEAVQRAAEGRPVLGDDQRQALLTAARSGRGAEEARLAPFRPLSPSEQAVLARLVTGESAETIADRTYVSLPTVRSHIRAILLKLGVNSQLAAVAMVRESGWSPPSG